MIFIKYSNIKLVMLLAGNGTRLYPLTLGFPKCLLSVKQKPQIFNMIDPMIKLGLRDIVLVVSKENIEIIKKFMSNIYSNLDVNIEYIIQEMPNGPGEAFRLTNLYIDKPIMLLLGDTICETPTNFYNSWIGVSTVSSSEKHKFCMVKSNNGIVESFIDKPQGVVSTNYAAIGIYFFENYTLLKKIFDMPVEKNDKEQELSDIYNMYKKTQKIYIKEFFKWEDTGNLISYSEVNSNSFNSRSFNQLKIDEYKMVDKKSDYDKIKSEIEWFEKTKGTAFEKVSPKFLKISDNNYKIEYYDYLSLSEYFTYYPMEKYNYQIIFRKMLEQLLYIYDDTKIKDDAFIDFEKQILITKTYYRINQWKRKDILDRNNVFINDEEYTGLFESLKLLNSSIEQLYMGSNGYISMIHGDPSFSNILFSPRSLIYKFIDPRGNFGIDTVYGDYRYDIAKLRHCYHGKYDEIVNDLFNINILKDKIYITFYKNNDLTYLDEELEKYGLNIDDIELIEGLLFISMIPLHSDYETRQIAFYTMGIKCLNNQIKKRGLDRSILC